MWYFKNSIVLICIWYINHVSVAKADCYYNHTDFGFNKTNVGLSPAKFSIALDVTDPDDPTWRVNIMKIRESFNLTVLANPFIKTQSDCPSFLIGNETLRRYNKTCTVNKDTNKHEMYFHKIVTGCYYFITMNETGNVWKIRPFFRNTSNRFYNTKLKVMGTPKFKPATYNSRSELKTLLQIPLPCIKVRAALYEFNKSIDALDHIKKSKILSTQECWFIKNGSTVEIINCKGSNLMTNITLVVQVHKESDEEWVARMTWTELRYGGGTYYFQVEPYTDVCEHKYGDDNINTWKIIEKNYPNDLGFHNEFNGPYGPELPDNFDNTIIILIACISLGVIVMATLTYWKWKHLRALRGNPKVNDIVEEKVLLCNEFNHILLVYARDSPLFMDTMNAFRDRLEHECNCHVHDLYTINEWNMAPTFGALEWVEQLLRNGTKVVWVDTPQFRSCSNKQQKQYTRIDFRDEAVPYAVALATNLFQNSATQYSQHFVVRLKEYEVTDESDDPLLVVSPHTRYFIPDNLPLLCENLKDPVKYLENTAHKE